MKRVLTAAILVAGIGGASIGTARAQEAPGTEPPLEISYSFSGGGIIGDDLASNAAQGQLFIGDTEVTTGANCVKSNNDPSQSDFSVVCDNLVGGTTYTVGVDNIGDYYVSSATCTPNDLGEIILPDENIILNKAIDDSGATFVQPGIGYTKCVVRLQAKPLLFVDKLVNGGDLISSDFPIEIYQGGELVASTQDPDDQRCEFDPFYNPSDITASPVADPALCANVPLEPGDYTIGEVLPEYGYVERSLDCQSEFDQPQQDTAQKQLASPTFDFPHSSPDFDATLCVLTNDYVTQDVTVDLVVINDDGGTATAGQFTIEVFDSSGTLVDTAIDPDPAEGSALQTLTLPIGDYTFGVSGPEGYTSSAEVTIVPILPAKAISTGADFTLTPDQTVAGVITVDDPPVDTTSTTTTTTTTNTTTTTLVPAPAPLPSVDTLAPTTTITIILPETGSNDNQTWTLLLMAIGSLILGAGAVIATRRS